jgi:putative MATE family efflux protein
MTTNNRFLNKYLGTKDFYKQVLLIILPIIAHTFITTLSQLVDNIMVGSISEVAISSVYITNQIFFVIQFIFFGISGASEIYISQFLGSKDDEGVNKFFNISILTSIIIGILLFIFININAYALVATFDTNPQVLYYGVQYLRLISFTLVLFGVNMAFGFAFRAYHMPKIPMYIGASTVIFNVLLNYMLIFGVYTNFLTIPAMGVLGAGFATLIARTIETTLYLLTSFIIKSPIKLNAKNFFKPQFNTIKKFVSSAVPLVSNDFLWASSIVFSIIIISNESLSFITGNYTNYSYYSNTEILASISVSSTFFNLFFMIVTGMGSATSIIVGKSLGAGNLQTAKEDANKLLALSLVISLISATLFALSIYIVPIFYNLEYNVLRYTERMILIMALAFTFNFLNSIIFFILRSGGDIKSVLILDSLFSWFVTIPAGLFFRYYLKADFITVFAILYFSDAIKLALAMYLYKKGTWIKNIT